ncbi:MAG: YifB family Mg chelatase-like AAA ATPase [Chlamydiales bacterium]
MGISKLKSVTFFGLEAYTVEVEVDVVYAEKKSSIVIVGLPDSAVKESKDRVLTASRNTILQSELIEATVNLAPGNLRKEGPLYDLPIALGVAWALQKYPYSIDPQDYIMIGELGLNGDVRAVRGALSAALHAKKLKKKGILLPLVNAQEASIVPGIDIVGIQTLQEALEFFKDPSSVTLFSSSKNTEFLNLPPSIDFADIKGQDHVKRAMEIAAAGNHNIVMSGPPGSGKSMFAKALIGITPELSIEEALEVTKIHSLAGRLSHHGIIRSRPFRAPHHTVSYAGLIGGGSHPRPGEVSLAHQGILFLDELPEYPRSVLEVLRQPLEDKYVTVSRAQGNVTFPTHFMFVAAMNPCPCGFRGHPDRPCTDTQLQVDRYLSRISGPIWDRIPMQVEVPSLKFEDYVSLTEKERSIVIKQRVTEAREIQYQRQGRMHTNASMPPSEVKKHCNLDGPCKDIIKNAMSSLHLSTRAVDGITRVARTIADLDNSENIKSSHLYEALSYRNQLKH